MFFFISKVDVTPEWGSASVCVAPSWNFPLETRVIRKNKSGQKKKNKEQASGG